MAWKSTYSDKGFDLSPFFSAFGIVPMPNLKPQNCSMFSLAFISSFDYHKIVSSCFKRTESIYLYIDLPFFFGSAETTPFTVGERHDTRFIFVT